MLLSPTEIQLLTLDVLMDVPADYPTMLVHDEGWFWSLPQGLVPADTEDVIDAMLQRLVELEGQVHDLQRRATLGDSLTTALQAQELINQLETASLVDFEVETSV